MKKLLVSCLALALGGLPGPVSAAVVIANPQQFPAISPELQSKIVIQQTPDGGNGYVVRALSDAGTTTYDTAFQTFTWTGASPLSGIGVKWLANSNNLNLAASNSYSYYLRVLQVDGPGEGASVTSTVAEYGFKFDAGDYGASSDYIYFTLPGNLALTDGGTYAFEIANDAYHGARRLTLAAVKKDGSYGGGMAIGANALPDNGVPSTLPDSSLTITDYVFFLTAPTAIPEPGVSFLLLGGLGV